MIGKNLLAMIDKRTRQAKPGEAEHPFGNMFVYLFGDIRQLPPVCDQPLYSNRTCSYGLSNDGMLAYRSFGHCHTLSVVQRQAGDSPEQVKFRDLLRRLSNGYSTHEDWDLLSTRFLSSLSREEVEQFANSLFIAPTKETVTAYNLQHLTDLGNPVAKICALHNCSKVAQGTEDAAQGLQATIYLSRGSRVMLRSNLWTAHGLVNGATGTVEDIVYAPHTKPPNDQPLCVLVKFDH
jgi:ATP-dependent DNA helicase PIF1